MLTVFDAVVVIRDEPHKFGVVHYLEHLEIRLVRVARLNSGD
jgi:hypothetical protein